MESSTSKKPRPETNFKLCLQCQEPDTCDLVTEPSEEAYSKFLQFVHERGQYGDADYAQISMRLQGFTATELKDKKAQWHRKCYGSTCHSGHLERARVRYQKACEQGESRHVQKRRGRPSLLATSIPDSLKTRLLTSHVQQQPRSMQTCVSSAKRTAKRQFMRSVHLVWESNCKGLLMAARTRHGKCG